MIEYETLCADASTTVSEATKRVLECCLNGNGAAARDWACAMADAACAYRELLAAREDD